MTSADATGDLTIAGRLLRPDDGFDRWLLEHAPLWSRSARFMRRMMAVPGWSVGPLSIENGTLHIGGWAVSPRFALRPPSLLVNGRRVRRVSWPEPRTDIDNFFWYVPQRLRGGLTARVPLEDVDRDGDGIEVGAVWRTAGGRHRLSSFFMCRPEADVYPLPDAQRRMRVHGGTEESAFRLVGYTSMRQVDGALRTVMNRPLNSFASILDWGCGCGRLTRYLGGTTSAITGVDIDSDSVAWCATNLPFGHFLHIEPDPPMPMPAGGFELVIGISIFTHLSEEDQWAWLRELHRVLAPGGIAAVTVSGNAAVARSGIPVPFVGHWLHVGFLDVGHSTDLDGAVDQPDRYRNVVHTASYVDTKWPSAGFTIAGRIPAAIGGHQDLVLLQRT